MISFRAQLSFTQKIFSPFNGNRNEKTRVKMTKPLYLGMPILDISKILMYELWYDYMNPKYGDRAKLCYTDTDSFIIKGTLMQI